MTQRITAHAIPEARIAIRLDVALAVLAPQGDFDFHGVGHEWIMPPHARDCNKKVLQCAKLCCTLGNMKTTALPDALHKAALKYADAMGMKLRTVVERAVAEYIGLKYPSPPAPRKAKP